MFVRAYLRASTAGQDATRAADALEAFASEHNHEVAAKYVENASGARPDRPELRRLLSDAKAGDVLLVEAIDRLSRLPQEEWQQLRNEIGGKGLRVVAVDLPTSHQAMSAGASDEFTQRMLSAINGMMLDMMAAIARKDYEQRRERQAQGIAKAKEAGVYKGRPIDTEKRRRILTALGRGFTIREAADLVGVSPTTVQRTKRDGIPLADYSLDGNRLRR